MACFCVGRRSCIPLRCRRELLLYPMSRSELVLESSVSGMTRGRMLLQLLFGVFDLWMGSRRLCTCVLSSNVYKRV